MLLVTGGAGFIGSHLIDRLLERNESVTCIDDFNDFYDPAIKRLNIQSHVRSARYRLVEGDIRNPDVLKSAFADGRVDKVIHLAARAGVRLSLVQPLLYADVNVQATIALLEMAKEHRVKQFVFASSSSVYGAQTTVPFTESDRIDRTISPYAATKYAGELMCYTYHHLYGIPTTCLRFFTAYGPRQRPEMAIHKFTRRIYDGRPIPFFGDGSTARDYTYIDDIIQGVLAAIDRPFPFEVFNLGESTAISLKELIRHIERETGRQAKLDLFPLQPGDVQITYADISKAKRMLGYAPAVSIDRGLQAFVKWYRSCQGR